MPTKNSSGKGKNEGGTVKKPKKLAVEKETIANPTDAGKKEKDHGTGHTCPEACYG
jgi:hypothetical protein